MFLYVGNPGNHFKLALLNIPHVQQKYLITVPNVLEVITKVEGIYTLYLISMTQSQSPSVLNVRFFLRFTKSIGWLSCIRFIVMWTLISFGFR